MFDVVVAADLDWGIGKDNALPWPRLRGDLMHFRRVTTGGAVVMGRKTWQSKEMAGKPLPNRQNIVVTRQGLAVPDGVVVAGSLDAGLAGAAGAVFVIGGAEIFRVAFAHPALRWIYLTRIEARFGCDVAIPALERDFVAAPWDGEQQLEDAGVRYRIARWCRESPTDPSLRSST